MSKTIVFSDNSLRELVNFREDVFYSYANLGYEVYLIAPINREYKPKSENIHIIPIKLSRSGTNPLSDISYLLTLIHLYIKIKPSFIFHYTVKPNIYGSIAAKILGIPSAAMIAGLGFLFGDKSLTGNIGRALYRFAMKFPKKIFVLNEMNKKLVLEYHLAKENQVVFLSGGEGINLDKFC